MNLNNLLGHLFKGVCLHHQKTRHGKTPWRVFCGIDPLGKGVSLDLQIQTIIQEICFLRQSLRYFPSISERLFCIFIATSGLFIE